jgi:Ca2+-binding RTX toxin-like protein
MRRILAAALMALVVLVAPAAANADWKAGVKDQWLVVDVSGRVYVTLEQDGRLEVSVGDVVEPGTGEDGEAGAGCVLLTTTEASCDGDVAGVRIQGGPGHDEIFVRLGGALHGEVYGDAGDDTIDGHTFATGAASETGLYVDGGPGKDTIVGSDGPDELHGGDGDDTLTGGPGADTYVGGPGDDDLGTEFARGGADVSVTLDGVANDGAPGERDSVNADIEQITVAGGRVTVVGSNAPELFSVSAASGSVDGGGGPDGIVARGGPGFSALGGAGNDVIRLRLGGAGVIADGGAGNDRLVGSGADETLLGGPGADSLEGGSGSDVLDGGPGRDRFAGDSGNDQIRGRDNVAETVDCGVGADSAEVDPTDAVAATCEGVDRTSNFTVTKVTSIPELITIGVTMTQRCAAACTVAADLVVDPRSARELGLPANGLLGGGSASLPGPGVATLTITVSPKLKRTLRELRALRVTLNVTVDAKTTTHTFSLKPCTGLRRVGAAEDNPSVGTTCHQPGRRRP